MKIRHKITLWIVGTGILTSLAFSLVVFLEMREQPLQILDSQLNLTCDAVAKEVSKNPDFLEAQKFNRTIIVQGSRYWLKIYDPLLQPIYQSELSRIVDIPLLSNKRNRAYTFDAHLLNNDVNHGEKEEIAFRVLVVEFQVENNTYLIQLASSMEKIDEEISELLRALGFGLALSAAILFCIGYFMAGQILKPISAINSLILKINEKTLSQRIPLGKSRDEIFELSTHLNNMLDRLEFSFAQQKQYLADASHELKSPIAMLRLFFEDAAQHSDLPEVWQNKLAGLQRNLLRLDRLVKTLLALSALEVNESLNVENFCLTELILSVLEDFAPLLQKTNIHLETDIPQNIYLQGDKDKIRRVFINIFDNAIKYNFNGGEIRFNIYDDGKSVKLSLYNTGPGIPYADREKVFEAFYRVEKSRSTHYGGAGLGLSIVKKIVNLHRGVVSIESELGEWTRVDITFPLT